MISVVIPLYNKERYIKRAICSVLNQSFGDFEIIIVNDGSTDNSLSIVEDIADARIKLINQKNAGVSAARNRGIMESKYDFIAFLDADDEWKENHLDVIVDLIQEFPSCGVFATSYYFLKKGIAPSTPILPNKFNFNGEKGIMDNYYEMAAGTDFPIHMSSFAVRKKDIQSIDGFPIGIPSGEDIITLARLFAICDFAYSKIPTSIYYILYETKNERPIQKMQPLDVAFDSLLTTAAQRKGVRQFVSSWHKRRMVGAIYAHHYKLMFHEFCKAFLIHPFQKKLYTSMLITFFSVWTGKDLYSINQKLKRRKK